MDTRKRSQVVVLSIVICAIAVVGYMSVISKTRTSQDVPSVPPIVARSKKSHATALKPLSVSLLLKIGGLARITKNDVGDKTKLSIYRTIDDVASYCQGSPGSTFDKPAKTVVRVLTYEHVWTQKGMGAVCNPVVQVAAVDGSWFGWIPSIAIRPNLAPGTRLMLGQVGSSTKIYARPDGSHSSFKVSGRTVLDLIEYNDTPGKAEFHVRVISGAAAGKTGWVFDDGEVHAENGYRLGLYESVRIASAENTVGGPGAYSDLENQPSEPPTADEDAVAQ